MAISKHHRRVNPDPLASEFIEESKFPTYTDTDLDRFQEQLEKFYEKKQVMGRDGMEEVSVLNLKEAAVAYGAMSKTETKGQPSYAVRVKPTDYDNYGNPSAYASPNLWDLFMDKYEQLVKMRGRRNFVEARKIEGLEELAQSMGVEHTSVEVDLETL